MNLADLKALSGEATPGPWEAGPYVGLDYYAERGEWQIDPRLTDGAELPIFREADAALIIALGSVREELLAVVEAGKRYREIVLNDRASLSRLTAGREFDRALAALDEKLEALGE